jgi:hypothetical protein
MPRLVTFGCSFTRGWDLHDTHPSNHTPSKFAWPSVLAKKLGYSVDNQSNGGSGNAEILNKIIRYNFKPDDLCIVAWSLFIRLDGFKYVSDTENIRLESSELNKDFVLFNAKYDYDLSVRNYLTMQHGSLLLEKLNIKSVSFLWSHDLHINPKPDYIEIPNFMDLRPFNYIVDKAIDNQHPGIRSHSLLADKIYDRMREYVVH